MVKKITKYLKFVVCCALIISLIAPSYAALSASDGSAFVTKAEFDAALADFNSRLTTFEAGINSKIDSQVTSYLDRNGIWNGKVQEFTWGTEGVKTLTTGSATIVPVIWSCSKSGLLMMSLPLRVLGASSTGYMFNSASNLYLIAIYATNGEPSWASDFNIVYSVMSQSTYYQMNFSAVESTYPKYHGVGLYKNAVSNFGSGNAFQWPTDKQRIVEGFTKTPSATTYTYSMVLNRASLVSTGSSDYFVYSTAYDGTTMGLYLLTGGGYTYDTMNGEGITQITAQMFVTKNSFVFAQFGGEIVVQIPGDSIRGSRVREVGIVNSCAVY